jgi:hypothetical protein
MAMKAAWFVVKNPKLVISAAVTVFGVAVKVSTKLR